MSFKAEEIQSKTLDRFMSNEQTPPEPEKEESGDVVKLPQIEKEEQVAEYEEEPVSYPEEPLPFEEEKCKCVPMIGNVNKKPANTPTTAGGSIFKGRGTYLLYGLMGLGLASQLLK